MTRNSWVLLTFFMLGSAAEASSQAIHSNPVSPSSEVNKIVTVCQNLHIGFPFDTEAMYSADLLKIGTRIHDLNQAGELAVDRRKGLIQRVLNENVHQANSFPMEARINLGAFASAEPTIDVYTLFAMMVLAGNTGEIEEIEPFLAFCKINMGDVDSGAMVSFAMFDRYHGLTQKQRLSFYPAAHAILSHPEVTKPLLLKAWRDETLPPILRLRAAFFLKEFSPDLINEAFITQIEDDKTIDLLRCAIRKEATWKTVYSGICGDYTITATRKAQREAMREKQNKRLSERNEHYDAWKAEQETRFSETRKE
jgi:hypothetical protein